MSRIHEALKKAEQERSEQKTNLTAAPEVSGTGEARHASAVIDYAPIPSPASMRDSIAAPPVTTVLSECQVQPWAPDPNTLVFTEGDNHSVGKEVFRTLRTRLYQIRDVQPLKSLLVTSALPGEGKTFVTSNLGYSIVRQRERRVLLIDGDLRLSRLHQPLGAQLNPGLSDYLTGEADESMILQRGREDNLFLIPGGKSVSNPTELLGSGRLEALLARLAPAFDWILIDSPPTVPVSDAAIIAKLCDGVLMVVRSGSTPFDLAQRACQEFQEKPVVGVVLNQADSREGYGGYDYGGYLDEPRSTMREA